jgi:hypothetical protein
MDTCLKASALSFQEAGAWARHGHAVMPGVCHRRRAPEANLMGVASPDAKSISKVGFVGHSSAFGSNTGLRWVVPKSCRKLLPINGHSTAGRAHRSQRRGCSQNSRVGNCSTFGSNALLPNPSFNLSPNSRPLGPAGALVYPAPAGPSALLLVPG